MIGGCIAIAGAMVIGSRNGKFKLQGLDMPEMGALSYPVDWDPEASNIPEANVPAFPVYRERATTD